jgi:hypothetical protein
MLIRRSDRLMIRYGNSLMGARAAGVDFTFSGAIGFLRKTAKKLF